MRFRTWNVRILHRAGSLKTVPCELARYNLDLVAVQEVRWNKAGGQPAVNYTFFYRNGNANHHLETHFPIDKEITSAVNSVKLTGDTMYITLRGH